MIRINGANLFFILLLVIGWNTSFSQSDLQKQNLQGKVKTVKEMDYDLGVDVNGEVVKMDQTKLIEFEFNEAGNVTGFADLNYNGGSVSTYYLNEYSDSGFLVKQTQYGGDNSIRSTHYYYWNEAGQQTSWIIRNPQDSVIYEYRNTYDKRGNKIRSESISHGKPGRYSECVYTKKGTHVCEKRYEADGTCLSIMKSEYDKWGHVVYAVMMDCNEHMLTKWIQKYNSSGYMSEMLWYDADTDIEQRVTYGYDAYGNQTEVKIYTLEDSLIGTWSYTYEYDEQHNWLVKTKLYDNTPLKRTERIIGYYE